MLRTGHLDRSLFRLLACTALAVCLAPAWAQDNGSAKLVYMSGQVSLLRDNYAWALTEGAVIQPKQVIVTGSDGMARFQVGDGSTIDVFPNSRFVFRATPSNWKDIVDVVIGRIKVHIQKLNGQPNPARVMSPTAVISVRGTTFDVNVEDDDETTLVSVEEGEVGVRNRVLGGEVSLHPGEWVRVFRNQPLAQRQIDRGGVVQGVLRAGAQALYDLLYRRQASGAPAGGVGGVPTTGNGDHDKGGTTPTGGTTGGTTAPPAPPAAPPPPPPPPPGQ